MQVQVALDGLELVQEPDKVLQAAAQAIDGPGCNHVYLAAGNVLEQAIEARTLVPALGAADGGIFVEANHLPARAGSNGLQLTSLVLRRLAVRGNTEIDADLLHAIPQ